MCRACLDTFPARIYPGREEKTPDAAAERSRIVTLLHNDVVSAQVALNAAKRDGSPEAAALNDLEKAVARYTDFTMRGAVPQDIRKRIQAS
jgi:hypothetical protein